MSKFVDQFTVTDESGNCKKEININLGDPLAREQSQKAMLTSEQAKQTANEAKQIAQEAKDAVPGEVSQQVEEATRELSEQVTEAKQTANESKQIAQEAYVIANMPNGGYTTNEVVNRYILAATAFVYPSGLLKAPEGLFVLYGNKGLGYYIRATKKDGSVSDIELKNGHNTINLPLRSGGSITLYVYAIFDQALYKYGEVAQPEADIKDEEFEFTDKVCSINQSSSYEANIEREHCINNVAIRAMNAVMIDYMLSSGEKTPSIVLIKAPYSAIIPKDGAIVEQTEYYKNLDYFINYGELNSETHFVGGNDVAVLLADCKNLTRINRLFGSGQESTPTLELRRFIYALGITNYENALIANGAEWMFCKLRYLEVVEFKNTSTPLENIRLKGMFYNTRSLKQVRLPNIRSAYMNSMFADSGIKILSLSPISKALSLDYMIAGAVWLETLEMDGVYCGEVESVNGFAHLTYNLKNFNGLEDIKISYSLGACAYLTHSSATSCISNLYDLTEGGTATEYAAQTLTFHPDVTAQLTEEEIAEATVKGWNIA